MKATELRIGNYVNDRERNLCEVIELGKNSIYAPALNKNITKLPNEPIPLTEEWLLKFGFIISCESEFRKKLDFKENTQFGYDFNKIGKENGMHGFRYYGRYHNCEFVHQLQNLYFALTGEELTQVSEGKNKNFVERSGLGEGCLTET